jgi:hypothetical protein
MLFIFSKYWLLKAHHYFSVILYLLLPKRLTPMLLLRFNSCLHSSPSGGLCREWTTFELLLDVSKSMSTGNKGTQGWRSDLACKIYPLCLNKELLNLKVILQHPVALHRSDFAFCFYAIYVQRQLLFTRRYSLLTLHFRPHRRIKKND